MSGGWIPEVKLLGSGSTLLGFSQRKESESKPWRPRGESGEAETKEPGEPQTLTRRELLDGEAVNGVSGCQPVKAERIERI